MVVSAVRQIVISPDKGPAPAPQAIVNGEYHDWYRIILGYSDHLVSGLIKDFGLEKGHRVLDPFCGTGTTLVECMKHGIDSVGIDANPSSIFAARVKTNWSLDRCHLLRLLEKVKKQYQKRQANLDPLTDDLTYRYIEQSGMIDRGWISRRPLLKAIAIKEGISSLGTTAQYKRPLLLALISEVVHSSSNVKFGPELYCSKRKKDAAVWDGFAQRVEGMADDLTKLPSVEPGFANVIHGDSRQRATLMEVGCGQFNAVICSPPYPTEHDYTRNSRLELAFLEEVFDQDSLRAVKSLMIRSHTKGIYRGDADAELVSRIKTIQDIAKKIDRLAKKESHGFARLYSSVVRHYFGGMRKHFRVLKPRLKRGAVCAYVVGDQSSYLRVHIPTAEILARLAELEGFKLVDIRHWRGRRSSTTSRYIDENVLIFRTTE